MSLSAWARRRWAPERSSICASPQRQSGMSRWATQAARSAIANRLSSIVTGKRINRSRSVSGIVVGPDMNQDYGAKQLPLWR